MTYMRPAVKSAHAGALAGASAPVNLRRFEALEDKVSRQLRALEQQLHKELDGQLTRLDTRLASLEGAQPRLERGVAELRGSFAGLSEALQSQIRRVDHSESRHTDWRRQLEEDARARYNDLDQKYHRANLGVRTHASTLEDTLKRLHHRMQSIEGGPTGMPPSPCIADPHELHTRLIGLEGAGSTWSQTASQCSPDRRSPQKFRMDAFDDMSPPRDMGNECRADSAAGEVKALWMRMEELTKELDEIRASPRMARLVSKEEWPEATVDQLASQLDELGPQVVEHQQRLNELATQLLGAGGGVPEVWAGVQKEMKALSSRVSTCEHITAAVRPALAAVRHDVGAASASVAAARAASEGSQQELQGLSKRVVACEADCASVRHSLQGAKEELRCFREGHVVAPAVAQDSTGAGAGGTPASASRLIVGEVHQELLVAKKALDDLRSGLATESQGLVGAVSKQQAVLEEGLSGLTDLIRKAVDADDNEVKCIQALTGKLSSLEGAISAMSVARGAEGIGDLPKSLADLAERVNGDEKATQEAHERILASIEELRLKVEVHRSPTPAS